MKQINEDVNNKFVNVQGTFYDEREVTKNHFKTDCYIEHFRKVINKMINSYAEKLTGVWRIVNAHLTM